MLVLNFDLQGLHVRMDLSTGKKEAKLLQKETPLPSSTAQPLKPVIAHVSCGEGSGPCAATEVEAAVTSSGAVALAEVPGSSAVAHALAPVAEDSPRRSRRPRSAMAAAAAEAAAEIQAEAAATALESDGSVDASSGTADNAGLPEAEARMQSILMALPEPEPELASAIASGRRGADLAELLQRVWARRQAVLREAMGSAKTEAQVMQGLLRQLLTAPAARSAAGSVDAPAGTGDVGAASIHTHPGTGAGGEAEEEAEDPRLSLLGDLEMHVAQLHNAEDFRGMGGITALVQLLNDTNIDVAAGAAWTLGTAVKYARAVQDAALQDGATVMLVQALGRARAALHGVMLPLGGGGPPPAVRPAVLRASLALAARCVYAIGALSRGHPQATAQLLSLGFSGELASLLAAVRGATVPYAQAAAAPGAAVAGRVGGVGASGAGQQHRQQQPGRMPPQAASAGAAAAGGAEPPHALDVPPHHVHPALRALNLPFALPTAVVEGNLRSGRGLCSKVVTLLADLAHEHAEALAEAADASDAAAAVADAEKGSSGSGGSGGHAATLTLLDTAHGKPLAAKAIGSSNSGEDAASAVTSDAGRGLQAPGAADRRSLLSSVCGLLQQVRAASLGAAEASLPARETSSATAFCSLSAGAPGVTPLGAKLGDGSTVKTSNRVDAALTEALAAADGTLMRACRVAPSSL